MRRRVSQGITVATVALSITVGISGCGAINNLSAKQKVGNAMSSFTDASSASFTLKLDTTANDIAAISQAEGEPMTASDIASVSKLLAADVDYSVQAPAGKKLGDTLDASKQQADLPSLLKDPAAFSAYLKKTGAVALSLRLSGKPLFEFRMVGGVIYVHAAAAKILQLAGQSPAELNQALASLPPGLAPLGRAAKGSWVSVDLAQVAQTLDSSGLGQLSAAAGSPTPSVDPSAVNKLITDLKAAYQKDVTITELPKSDRGDGYQLSASAKQVAAAVQDDVIKLAGAASAADVKKGIAKLRATPINLDIWVKDDKLTGLTLDLTQFLDKKPAGAKLGLDVGVALDSGSVVAPTGATPLDVKSLIQEASSYGASMGAGLSSGSGFSGGGSSDDPFSGFATAKAHV